jgi:GR25 family glycosyltransferase involved in LPS biosynthesis
MLQSKPIYGYMLYSKREQARLPQVKLIQDAIEHIELVEAVYPKNTHVPFLDKMIQLSKLRTGRALLTNEIGVLLGHRIIWKRIVKSALSDDEHFLIFESDSKINDLVLLKSNFDRYTSNYDLFFWGAWDGYARIHRSTIKFNESQYKIGTPLIKSVYCTYGYSLNKKAATLLLHSTKKISYPVDIFKKYIPKSALRVGAVRPEVISAWYNTPSTIRVESTFKKLKNWCIVQIFDLRNRIHAYFS